MDFRFSDYTQYIKNFSKFIPNLKTIIIKTLYFIPSYRNFGLITKITVTIFLAGICGDLFYAKIDQAIPIIKGALSFSPYQYAEDLYKEGKLKTAYNYIQFYETIPGIDAKKFADLKEKIESGRDITTLQGIKHHAGEALKSAKGEESDEIYSSVVSTAVDFTSIGDIRELYKEWNNYSKNNDVDKLNAGMAGIGLAMTIGELVPGTIALIEPLKKPLTMIRKSLKTMSSSLKKSIKKIFEPLIESIAKSKIFKNIDWTSLKSIRSSVTSKSDEFVNIAKKSKNVFGELGDFVPLAMKNPSAVPDVIKYSSNIEELKSFSKVAMTMGEESSSILRFGGKNALEAGVELTKKGVKDQSIIKKSMRYGKSGLKAVEKGISMKRITKAVDLLNNSFTLLKLFMFTWLLSQIPWLMAFVIWLFLGLVIAKSWLWKFITN